MKESKPVTEGKTAEESIIDLEALKRVCYHFAGKVAVGFAPNAGSDFDYAWEKWLETGQIHRWYSHPSTSTEVVTVHQLIASQFKEAKPAESEVKESEPPRQPLNPVNLSENESPDYYQDKLRYDQEVTLPEKAEQLAREYSNWCWGKVIPTEVGEIERFFLRFLKETKRL